MRDPGRLARFLGDKEAYCLLGNATGIFPLRLTQLSPAGATLSFDHHYDISNFSVGQRVRIVDGEQRFRQLLRGKAADVVWLRGEGLGISFIPPLVVSLDDIRKALGA